MWHAIDSFEPIHTTKDNVGCIELDGIPNPFCSAKPNEFHGSGLISELSNKPTASFLRYRLQGGHPTDQLHFQGVVVELGNLIESRAIDIPVGEQVRQVCTGVDSQFRAEEFTSGRTYTF